MCDIHSVHILRTYGAAIWRQQCAYIRTSPSHKTNAENFLNEMKQNTFSFSINITSHKLIQSCRNVFIHTSKKQRGLTRVHCTPCLPLHGIKHIPHSVLHLSAQLRVICRITRTSRTKLACLALKPSQ